MFEMSAMALPTDKKELYQVLCEQARGLLEGEHDLIARAANFAALVYHGVPDLNWAGFYLLKNGELVVGPFQGKPACVRIAIGKGVCGTAAKTGQTQLVPNVHEFPGHIACDSASNSEIVVPLMLRGELFGVWDVDSPTLNRLDAVDQAGMEALAEIFMSEL
jgi:L-methionine (R)-S-oxide reductase